MTTFRCYGRPLPLGEVARLDGYAIETMRHASNWHNLPLIGSGSALVWVWVWRWGPGPLAGLSGWLCAHVH